MTKSTTRALIFWAITLLAIAGLYGWRIYGPRPSAAQAGVSAGHNAALERPVGDFTLTDQNGEPFSTTALKGDVWIASFFFTSCPGACIKLNQAIESLEEEFDTAALQFVSITVQPRYDRPEILRDYARRFAVDPARWHFLTGQPEEIHRVAQDQFLVSAEPGTHSSRLVLVDRSGTIRGYYLSIDDADMARLKLQLHKMLKDPS